MEEVRKEGYYYLEKGEVIKEGDEVEVSSKYNDSARWQPTKCAGGLAPDPEIMSHRIYRRKLTPPTDKL